MRILGIDPGSRVTGFGIIDVSSSHQSRYVASGVIKTVQTINGKPVGGSLAERIGEIVHGIEQVCQLYQPTVAAVEQVFVNVNPAATLMLGQARGAAIAALVLANLPVHEYTALQVKKSVVGQGKAAKEQVQAMVMRLLNLSAAPSSDASDALACALCHAQVAAMIAATGKIGVPMINPETGKPLKLKAGRWV
jgi:crossover junction endodeoxyribonuclease RuvC